MQPTRLRVSAKLLFTVLVILTLIGCAPTRYQPSKGNITGGYTDIKIGPDMYRISFEGNAYITGEKAYQYTLYRAAECGGPQKLDHVISSELTPAERS